MVEIADADGRSWFEASLRNGFDLSEAVLSSTLVNNGRFHTFFPDNRSHAGLEFPEQGVLPPGTGDSGLAQFFDHLTSESAMCVVIEDDVGRRTHPDLDEMAVPSAFLGERIIHWCEIPPESGKRVTAAIRESAFGYPLNAFVVNKSAAELGLINGHPAPKNLASQVVDSLNALVVSAFDGQSFAVWSRDI